MEFKRKFLLENLPLGIDKFSKLEMEKCFISYDPKLEIKKINNTFYITKGNDTLEVQKINADTYNFLLSFVPNNRINKTKYFVPISAKLTAIIDVYANDLKTVKIIFENESEMINFNVPNWFGTEITNNIEFQGSNLVKHVQKKKN